MKKKLFVYFLSNGSLSLSYSSLCVKNIEFINFNKVKKPKKVSINSNKKKTINKS